MRKTAAQTLTPRFKHQIKEARHKYAKARAFAWQMRTGKSRMAVEHAEALENCFEINGVLIVAPNGVHRDWAERHIPLWYTKTVSAFTWCFSDKDNVKNFNLWLPTLGVRTHLHWMCVNTEVVIRSEVQKAITLFRKRVGPFLLVADESHNFGTPGSKRSGYMRGLGRAAAYRRILSGTISEESPLKTFSQYEILDSGALGHTTFNGTAKGSESRIPCPTCGTRCCGFKYEFADFVMTRRGPEVDGYKNLDVLKRRMAKYTSVVLREDCEDLPAVQPDVRHIEMTELQQRWWKAVRKKSLEESDKLGINQIFSGGAALTKLHQIEGGFMIDKDTKQVMDICGKQNPKMLILLDEIKQYDGQVIIWFEFLHEIDAALAFLRRAGVKCGVFSGPTKKTRDRDLAAFQSGKLGALLAQPQAGGVGREMSAAGKMIWFSHTASAVIRSQATERATKMKGKSVQLVDFLTPVGKFLLQITSGKRTIADDVSRYGLRAILEGLSL